MTDEGTTDEGGMASWVVAALIVAAIVLLLLFARGPEDQGRAAALLRLVTALAA